MKITITKKTEVEVELKTFHVEARVRYWNDGVINGEEDTENGDNVPCKDGNYWMPIIEIATGKILNWKQGVTAEIHYKVCDGFNYEVRDVNDKLIFHEEDTYVLDMMCPERNGYGDYIIMDINENGEIANWNFDISQIHQL